MRIRELVLLAGLVALGLRCLPAPIGPVFSALAPPVFLASRLFPGLRPWLVAACVLWPDFVLMAPTQATGDGFNQDPARAACASLAPLQLRLMTWRSRSESWDLLDPLVIVTTPVAFILVLVVVVRMFEIHLLSWS